MAAPDAHSRVMPWQALGQSALFRSAAHPIVGSMHLGRFSVGWIFRIFRIVEID